MVSEINVSIFYACLRLRFLDVETNPIPRRPVSAVCRILYSNVWGLSRNLSDLTVLRFGTISSCALILWSQIWVSLASRGRSCWFQYFVSRSGCALAECLECLGKWWLRMYMMDTLHFVNPNLNVFVFVVKSYFLGIVVRDINFRFSVFTVFLI